MIKYTSTLRVHLVTFQTPALDCIITSLQDSSAASYAGGLFDSSMCQRASSVEKFLQCEAVGNLQTPM